MSAKNTCKGATSVAEFNSKTEADTEAIINISAAEANVENASMNVFKSAISDMERVNDSNMFTEENFYILQWLYRIRRASCARGLRVGFLQPDFLWSIYGPMMRSKKLWRTDGDIRASVNLWCDDRVAAEERYGHISEWDVSSVTDMSKLFRGKKTFNDDISRWDVSKVTDMSFIFCGAHSFDQPVGDWDVSKVTNMSWMFDSARVFDQAIGDWAVSNVTNMNCMFYNAQLFDQDLTRWDLRSGTNTANMFANTPAMQRDNKPTSLI
jgi:surface protein